MRVKTWVTIDQEVEVSVDSNDVREMLGESMEEIEEGSRVGNLLNTIAVCLKGISDAHIADMHPRARELTHQFFLDQAQRFAAVDEVVSTE